MKNRKTNFIMLMLSSVLCFTACNNAADQSTVKIGNQEWMTNNLNVSTFKNGDTIPEAKSDEAWIKAGEEGKPAWCYYDNDPENGNKYGRLYNWYAVTDPRGLAPSGWHIPSDAEWTTLTDNLGGEDVAGHKMKSQAGWDYEGNGSNASGFSGLPGGFRDYSGTFYFIGSNGDWWSSTEDDTYDAWARLLYYDGGDVGSYSGNEATGFSVRCLRD